VGIDDLSRGLPMVLAWLAASGHAVHRVTSGHATLENVFLALTGRQLRD
jgi:ABC-2 type transport system ATP-binding protein